MKIGSSSRRRWYAIAAAAAAATAAAGLIGGGVASAQGSASAPPAPRTDASIPNLGKTEMRIEAYYGDPTGTGVASAHSNYARQTDGLAAGTRHYLQSRLAHRGHGKPALVLDIDDTSLITYGYEVSEGFGFTSASNLAYLQAHTLPAVFGMPLSRTGPPGTGSRCSGSPAGTRASGR